MIYLWKKLEMQVQFLLFLVQQQQQIPLKLFNRSGEN